MRAILTRGRLLKGGTLAVVMLALAACAVRHTGAIDDPTSPPTGEPNVPPEAGVALEAYLTIVNVGEDVVEASGGVSGVLESGGACAFVFESPSAETITVESEGVSDVSGTSCGLVEVDIDRFAAGPWTVVLDYVSPSGEAHSAPFDLEVP